MTDAKKKDDDTTVDYKLMDDPAFQEIQKAVKGIALLVQNQTTSQAKMQTDFTAALEKLGDSKEKPKHISLEDQQEAINDLDNAGLLQLVVAEVGKVVDDKLGTVAEKLEETNQGISDTRLTGELKQLMNDNPDFLDWKSELGAMAKSHPSLSMEEAFDLVRIKNPEKVIEMKEKYKDVKEEDDKGSFLSLMPTGGAYDDSDEKPTKEEAGNKAWDETVSQFPALASTGDE